MARHVALRRLSRHILLLEVHWKGDVRDAAISERRAAGEIGDVAHVRGAHDADVVLRDVDEQLVELDVLLGMRADQIVERHAGDRQDRRAVELGVIQAVQEMDAAGTGGGEADAQPARKLRIRARHERRGFLVTHLDKADLILAPA